MKESKKGTATVVDQYIGQRLRSRRLELKMSQGKLAGALGISFQQLQKYESGVNRISASRLYRISEVLDVPISYFFPEDIAPSKGPNIVSKKKSKIPDDIIKGRETQLLLKLFQANQNKESRKALLDLVKKMARLHRSD